MRERSEVLKLAFDPGRLQIDWADGHHSEYQAQWLRDNCPEDRDPRNGQRRVDIADLPQQTTIGAVSHSDSPSVLLTWSGEPKSSWFSLEWLRDHCYCEHHRRSRNRIPILWTAERTNDLLWLDYQVLESPAAHTRWLRALADYGIAFLRNVPCVEGQVLEIAGLIGYVRETNYGRIFDVRSIEKPNNLAYSDLGLGVHTDNPYREPVPGLQILHCLQSSDEGGESVFVDGFAVAERLRTEHPKEFETLARIEVPFAFCDDSAELRARRPLLSVSAAGELQAVHYNSRSIAPLSLDPDQLAQFYEAYRLFAQLLRSAMFEFRTRLGNGDLVAFNNRRLLHGRTAFTSGANQRWLQGCYLDQDGLFSKLALLERKAQGASPSRKRESISSRTSSHSATLSTT
jgi:[2-(trimethylamino)ethyl]phosphonate dioxygenase